MHNLDYNNLATIKIGPYINNTICMYFFERKIYYHINLLVQWRKLVPTKGGNDILGFQTSME